MPREGEMAPDFELRNQHGELVKLSDYRGRKVLLFAYPKGRHFWLYRTGLRLPRSLPANRNGKRGRAWA